MLVIDDVKTLQQVLNALRDAGQKVSFVPTMGALHEGHMSLIDIANKHADVTVCSVFVNPTQFNEASDLDKYPRTFEADRDLLQSRNCDILFFPGVEEVYPNGSDEKVSIDLGELDKVLEGEFRPGHFEGVVQVVKRLLEIVEPQYLIMGQKDFQQFTIVQKMINFFNIPTELVVAPIKREADGLAMSSRNTRLDKGIRLQADVLFNTLDYAKRRINQDTVSSIKEYARKKLNDEHFKLEYFEIINGHTLLPVEEENVDDLDYVVAATAVWAGDVRLIDNMILKK